MSVFAVPTDKKVYLKYDTKKEVVLDTAQFNIDPRPDIKIRYSSLIYDDSGFITEWVENIETHEVTVSSTTLFNTFQFTYDLSDFLREEPKGAINPTINLFTGFWARGPFEYADGSNIYLPDNISSEIDYVNSFQSNETGLQFADLILDEYYNYDKAYLIDNRIVLPYSNFTKTEYVADVTYVSNQTHDVVTERITLLVDPEHDDSLTFVGSIESGTDYWSDLQFHFLGHQEDLGINGVLIPNSSWGAYDAYERKLDFINEHFNGAKSIISNPKIQIVGDILVLNPEFVENEHDIDFVYNWYRDNELISDHSESSYKIQSTDMGSNIRVEVEYAAAGIEGVLQSKDVKVAVKEFPYEIFPTKGAFSILSGTGILQAWGHPSWGGSINTPNVLNEVEDIFVGRGVYAALFSDGRVSTWGMDKGAQVPFFGKSYPVENIYMDGPGFVALKSGGTVSSWGSPYDDSGIENLTDVVEIFSSGLAHAALKADGSVYVWGRSDYEGDASAVADQISSGVVEIFSSGSSFAALKDDGSVVTWGYSDHGGDSSSVAEKLTSNVKAIFTTNAAYAALKEDGSLVTWGNADYGGDSSFVSENLSSDVVNVFANAGAFAALKQNGSVVTWGNADLGGESGSVSENLSSDVVKIFPNTFYAFAAVKKDGSVVTWGHEDYGGDSSTVVNQLSSNVVEIFSSDGAFAALKDDGSVVTWGHERYGGNSTNVQDQLNDVVDIYGTAYSGAFPYELVDGGAFAAVKYDGSLVTWGSDAHGGDSSNIEIFIENTPPEFIFSESNASISAIEDEIFEYHLQAYDVDGDDLTFQTSQIPDWLILDEQEGILSGKPRDDDVGMHNFILSVSDSEGDKTEIEININVLNSPDYQLNTSVLEIRESDFYASLDNGIYSVVGNLFFEETRSKEQTYFDRVFGTTDTHYFNNSGRGQLEFSVNQGIYEINIDTNLLDFSLYEPISVHENYNVFTSPSFLIEKSFNQIERIGVRDGFPIYPVSEIDFDFAISDPNKAVHQFTIKLVPDVENYEPEFYSLNTRPGQYSITGGMISKILWHDFGVNNFIHEDGILTQFSREERNDVEITLFDKNFDDLIIEPITDGVNKVSGNTRVKSYYTQNLLSRDTGAIRFSVDLKDHREINFDVEEKITLEFTVSDNKTTKIIPVEIPVALNRTVSNFESNFEATEYSDYLLISGKDKIISANAGNDLIETENTAGHNVYSLGVGNDTAIMRSDKNSVNLGQGSDQLILHASNTWTDDYIVKNVAYSDGEIATGQTVLIEGKNRFSDVIDGGEGFDTIVLTDGDDVFVLQDSYSEFHSAQNLQLDESGRLGAQRIIEIENIICGAGDDVIDLTSTNYLISDSGIKIEGDEGDDTIWGTPHNDEILGGDGNDTIFGGSGNDLLTGGLGGDTFEFTATAGEDTITDFNILDDLLVFYATSGDSKEVSSATGSTIVWNDVTINLGMSEVYTEQTLLENINVEFVLI